MRQKRSTAGSYLKIQQMHTDLSSEQAPGTSAPCPKPWQQQYVENELADKGQRELRMGAKALGELSES